MEEESDLNIRLALTDFLTEHCGKQHQMIIVNPYKVAILNFFGNCFGKETIGFLVCIPS